MHFYIYRTYSLVQSLWGCIKSFLKYSVTRIRLGGRMYNWVYPCILWALLNYYVYNMTYYDLYWTDLYIYAFLLPHKKLAFAQYGACTVRTLDMQCSCIKTRLGESRLIWICGAKKLVRAIIIIVASEVVWWTLRRLCFQSHVFRTTKFKLQCCHLYKFKLQCCYLYSVLNLTRILHNSYPQ